MSESADEVARLLHSWEQRRVKGRPLQPISRLVNRVVVKRGLSNRLGREAMESAWNQVCGPRWSKQVRLGALRDGILEVLADNSMVIQELAFEQELLLKQLQQALPDVRIRRLALRVGCS